MKGAGIAALLLALASSRGGEDREKGASGAKAPPKGAPRPAEKPAKGVTGAGRKSLVANGDFESGGRAGPASWQRLDGLTSFWVDAPGRKGKCIKIDTDVLASQFRAREDEMEKARSEKREPPPPPKRKPTTPPKYDTVAALDGVHFGCDPFTADPKKHYLLEADVRVEGGNAAPKVWVKAFGPAKSRDLARERELWKKSLNCEGAGPEWKTFRMVFPRDTSIPERATKFRLYLYPYWPPATYFFDNVRLAEITEEEAKAFGEEHGLLQKENKK